MTTAMDGAVLAGALLAAGGVLLFLLVGPTAAISPAIWNGPPGTALPLIHAHVRIWRVANVGFALATIVTAAGMVLLPAVVGASGATWAWVAAVVYALAAVPWLVVLAIRVVVVPGVAAAFVAEGSVDPAHAPLAALNSASILRTLSKL